MGQVTYRRFGALAIVALTIAAGCDASSDTTAPAPNHKSTFEARPVIATLPANDPTLVGQPDPASYGAEVILPRTAKPPHARYALGPVLLTAADVRSATTNDRRDILMGWSVEVRLTTDGRRKLGELAAKAWGVAPPRDSMGLIVDGVLWEVAAFQSPEPPAALDIGRSLTEAEAKRIATGLNHA